MRQTAVLLLGALALARGFNFPAAGRRARPGTAAAPLYCAPAEDDAGAEPEPVPEPEAAAPAPVPAPPAQPAPSAKEADALLDAMVLELTAEKELAAAKGDFEAAMEARDKIRAASVGDGAKVLAQNTEFYRSFSARDITSMKELWEHADDVSCIHPGSPIKVGHKAVVRAWERMFKEDRSRQPEPHIIRAGDVRVFVRGTTAVVTCTENIFRKGGNDGPMAALGGGPPRNAVLARLHATNIYRRSYGEWRLVHHHASQVEGKGSRAGGMGAEGIGGNAFQVRLNSDNIDSIREIIRNKLERQGLGGDDSTRIIAINGQSLDDNDDDGPGDTDEFAQIVADKVKTSISHKLDKIAAKQGSIPSLAGGNEDGPNLLGAGAPAVAQAMEDEGLRKDTVALIRRLSSVEEGRLTMRQKQLLLGDVIRAAAERPSRKSLVEMAYSVLMLDASSNEEALDDFAEQCVMLSEQLEEQQ